MSTILDLLNSDYALLRRMSLLLLRRYCIIDAEIIVSKLLDFFTLHELEEREQLFKIISAFFDEISDESRTHVIDIIWDVNVDGMHFESDEDKERHINYLRFNWLKWLETHNRHLTEVSEKLSIINRKFPDFAPRERPDLVIGPIETRWGSESPISKETLVSYTIRDACEYLINYKEDYSIMGPDRFGLMQVVSEACQKDVKWGLSLIDELRMRDYWTDDLWDAIFRGLAKGINKKLEFIKVIKCIDDEIIINCGLSIAAFIYEMVYKETVSKDITKNLRNNLVSLVKRMWPFRVVSEDNNTNIINVSLNYSTGLITRILMRLMFLQPTERSIPAWLDSIIKKQIEGSENIEEYIGVICGYSANLFYRNPEWTRMHVLRYLDDDDSKIRKAAWVGFLMKVSNFGIEFGNEMIPYFEKNIQTLPEFELDCRSRFIHDYALLLVYITDDPTTNYLSELFKVADDIDRKQFAQSISKFLNEMKAEERSDLWNRWLKKYWRNRNNNIPVSITREEYHQMLFWLIGLPEYEEGVDIAVETDLRHISPNLFLHTLIESDEKDQYPDRTALLVIHLIKNTDRKYIDSRITGLISDLKNKVKPEIKTELENIYTR